MNRLVLLLAALLACGLIAAGCGDDDDDNGDDSPATTESVPAAPTDTDAGEVTPPPGFDSVEDAVEACKENVQTSGQQLSEDLRNDLEDICEQAAGGDTEELQEATADICKRIVEETAPSDEAREQGLAACESTATP
jgi:hypothetical protein